MKILKVIGVTLCLGLINAEVFAEPPALPDMQPITLPNTTEFLLSSEDQSEPFRIMVAAPDVPAPKEGYAVIYVTDGNSIFGALRDELRRQLSDSYQVPTLLVAIGYPEDKPWNDVRREHDLTPSIPGFADLHGPWGEKVPNIGGADDFLEFIEFTLKPIIESNYKVNKSRETLTGHSFGGLFTLYTFFTKNTYFDNYVAMSPSIWLGDEYILNAEAQYRGRYRDYPDSTKLLITVGQCEQIIGECDPALKSSPERDIWLVKTGRMVDNARAMQQRLSAIKGSAVQVQVINGEHHLSVISASIARAMWFAVGKL